MPCNSADNETNFDTAYAVTFRCVTCSAAGTTGQHCTDNACEAGWWWNAAATGTENKCPQCGADCIACEEGSTTCTTCASTDAGARGLYKDLAVDRACKECTHEHCETCSVLNNCDKCKDSYYKDADNACITCGSPGSGGACATCEFTGTPATVKCTKCTAPQVLENGICGACASGCAECGATDGGAGIIGACRTCSSGYYLTLNTCTGCSAECKTCDADGCT